MKSARLVVSVAHWLTFAYFCSYLLVTLVPPVQLQLNCFLSQRKVFGTCFFFVSSPQDRVSSEAAETPKTQKWFTMPAEKNHNVHIQTDSLMSRPWWCCDLHSFSPRLLNYSFIDFYRATPSPSTEREKVNRTLALNHQQFYKISTSVPTLGN